VNAKLDRAYACAWEFNVVVVATEFGSSTSWRAFWKEFGSKRSGTGSAELRSSCGDEIPVQWWRLGGLEL